MKEVVLEKLPYPEDALAPVISPATVSFHYGRHHAGYVKTLNGLIAGTKFEGLPLEEIVRISSRENNTPVFNNAAQAWNHAFYWHSLAPEGKGGPVSPRLKAALDAAFGSREGCMKLLVEKAVSRFGSGWSWLVSRMDGRLAVVNSANADTPLQDATLTPLAVVDVWEHAYYLDWQNRRADYAQAVVGRLLDWGAVSRRYEARAE